MSRGQKTDLKVLLETNPVAVVTKIKSLLATMPLKEVASELGLPYATFHRLLKDLGLLQGGRSDLKSVTGEEWAKLGVPGVASKYKKSYNHVYAYRTYHREEIDGKISEWKNRTTSADGVVADRPNGDRTDDE